MKEKPMIIEGGLFSDERGKMRFVNDFSLEEVKRFYFIKHPDIAVVRAWQGHQFEKKYFYPISGSFVIAWVQIDNFENPSMDLVPEHHVISANKSEILSIPKGYANGLRALEPDSEILIFSDMCLEESVNEKIRYPSKRWFDWEKFNEK